MLTYITLYEHHLSLETISYLKRNRICVVTMVLRQIRVLACPLKSSRGRLLPTTSSTACAHLLTSAFRPTKQLIPIKRAATRAMTTAHNEQVCRHGIL